MTRLIIQLARLILRHQQEATAQYYTENLGNGVELDMVLIPGGSFWMGTEDEEIERLCKTYDVEYYFKAETPQHKVTIPTFFMGRYPITQEQWRRVAGWKQVERELDPDPSEFKDDYEGIERWQRPVESISWDDAKEFCNRLSKKTKREYRLPTEAEWEYACRAVMSNQRCDPSQGTLPTDWLPNADQEREPPFEGKRAPRELSVTSGDLNKAQWNEQYNQPFHFGETISTQLANYNGNYTYGRSVKGEDRDQTTPVGYFEVANNFGLCDMHGNVWEWCEDDYHNSYQGAPSDGSAWLSGGSSVKVLRGGSCFLSPRYCRSACRAWDTSTDRGSSFGFRVVHVSPKITWK